MSGEIKEKKETKKKRKEIEAGDSGTGVIIKANMVERGGNMVNRSRKGKEKKHKREERI